MIYVFSVSLSWNIGHHSAGYYEIMKPTILEANEAGEIRIPAGLSKAGPRARFRLEPTGGAAFRLTPETSSSRPWTCAAPQDRARIFREWVALLPKRNGPALPASALTREALYD
jgi:hypothetical protein